MAATRLIALHVNKGKTVAQCLADRTDYAQNGEKTEDGTYVTGYECDPETCDEEFLLSKRQYQEITGRVQKNDVIAYQIRQSFKPGEVTAEEANQIGYELGMRFTKGKHAFIVATHTDKAHIHNHIVFNSTTLDCTGKFKDFHLSGIALRRVSDRICAEHGLSIIIPRAYRDREKYQDPRFKKSIRDEIREALDNAIAAEPKDLDDLLNFFPEANIKKISEIEHFHKKMQGILKQQMQIEASQVEKNISELNAKMEALMNKQHELGRTVTLSNKFLDKYNELIREISRLKKENQAFTQAENLKDKYKEQKNIKESIQKDVLKIVADKLNKQMENLCYMVYEGRKSAPVLDFKSGSKYSFTTENDAGMGTSFKSLIIFDISVLKLTVLPAIAHDTLMFKNIEDKHFKSILEIYSSFNDEPEDKQIFIACDKQDSYGDDVRNLLQNTCVIQLGPDGNELFGYSWAKRMEN